MNGDNNNEIPKHRVFRIQEAILILRQGKTHPYWREAAWHLMENAGKDTQLLLEAQRDLLKAAQPQPTFWSKYGHILLLILLKSTEIALFRIT